MAGFGLSRMIVGDTDARLLRAYANGDHSAFDRLYLSHKDGLYNFVMRTLAQPAPAEEIVQEVWMVVIDQAQKLELKNATFRTWLYRVASNKVADFFRRKINHSEELDQEQLAASGLSADERVLLEQLLTALGELPEDQRVAFVLQQEGFSHREIAEITNVGSETVKSRLRYAKSATRRRMELMS